MGNNIEQCGDPEAHRFHVLGCPKPKAAPAPQAEADTSWGCHHSIPTPGCKVCGRGAAPAETARHEDAVVVEDANRLRIAYGGETAGEMTARELAIDAIFRHCGNNLDEMEYEDWRDLIEEVAETHAKQRVEQAERLLRERTLSYRAMADSEFEMRRKVADLERERDTLRRERKGEVWCWGDDGEDHPESLNCPVLMQPDVVRRFVAAESELREMREALGEAKGLLQETINDHIAENDCGDHPCAWCDEAKAVLARKAGS